MYLYSTESGRMPVLEYIFALEPVRQKKAFALLEYVREQGLPKHNPERCKKLEGEDFWELKPSQNDRMFFCEDGARGIVLLHAFTKARNRTPPHEIQVGRARYREVIEEWDLR